MRERQLQRMAAAMAVVLLSSCNQDSQVEPIVTRVAELEGQVGGLKKQLEQLQFQIKWQSQADVLDSVAYLTPGSDGYDVVKMDLGYLTVSLENIAAYANGSKVSLAFGNLTSATINGLKAKIEWGSVDDKGMPNIQDAKSQEITLSKSLSSGAWNKVEVILEGVPPAALGFVRLREVSHQGIGLRGQFR